MISLRTSYELTGADAHRCLALSSLNKDKLINLNLKYIVMCEIYRRNECMNLDNSTTADKMHVF